MPCVFSNLVKQMNVLQKESWKGKKQLQLKNDDDDGQLSDIYVKYTCLYCWLGLHGSGEDENHNFFQLEYKSVA